MRAATGTVWPARVPCPGASRERHQNPRVPSTRLSDQVASRIQSLILDNGLPHGERLPSERELCEMLGVSRTALREGVRSLVAKGLLDVRQGGGTVVRTPDIRLASEMMTILLRVNGASVFDRVHEVRRLLEVEIAGLAARRRTDQEVEALRAQLTEHASRSDDHHAWALGDVEFHAALAVATHNPLYPVLLNSMADMLTELRLTAARLPDTPQRAHGFHTAIVDAVEARDRVRARRAMTEHMNEAEATFQRARLVRGLAISE